ncbi:hypothetical protein R1sor_022318 [Riccia sorocarpa]|uniref:Uncharacterized protein n=1 Tax=Riccia sorocarpa TaxID=122646 RepID=A0ABD3GLH2_9MARC
MTGTEYTNSVEQNEDVTFKGALEAFKAVCLDGFNAQQDANIPTVTPRRALRDISNENICPLTREDSKSPIAKRSRSQNHAMDILAAQIANQSANQKSGHLNSQSTTQQNNVEPADPNSKGKAPVMDSGKGVSAGLLPKILNRAKPGNIALAPTAGGSSIPAPGGVVPLQSRNVPATYASKRL